MNARFESVKTVLAASADEALRDDLEALFEACADA
jgi:hypothetical protein